VTAPDEEDPTGGYADVADFEPDGAADVLVPLCRDVETWVNHIYAPTFIRRTTQLQRWCPSWWAHPEAIVRLTALWRTWEIARVAETGDGIADWLRGYFDPINPVLLGAEGPFGSCTPDRHTDTPALPVTPAPGDWWDHPADY
jgi:hypothetical protein